MVLSDELWKRSGHWDHFKDNMYFLEVDERTYAVKPMNCPGCCLVFGSHARSRYRDLPLRLAEFGRVYRHELSGVLHGRDARAHLHPGRRAHLLRARADGRPRSPT